MMTSYTGNAAFECVWSISLDRITTTESLQSSLRSLDMSEPEGPRQC